MSILALDKSHLLTQTLCMKRIMGPMRRAILEYGQISNGDKIAVGLSGGKDSLVLLNALNAYRKYTGVSFELVAITIDQTNGLAVFDDLIAHCKAIDVPYFIVKTNIFEVVFDERKETNPCSLCAKMRRGSLNTAAKENGCNKVALAHHKDDMMQTFFLSLLHEGRLSSFKPVTHLSNTDITVIRPLIYVDEQTITNVAKNMNLPILANPCPANKHTRREDMKNLISALDKEYAGSRELIFTALTHPERINLPGVKNVEIEINRENKK